MARDTAQWFRDFGRQAASVSPQYEAWAGAIADDPATVALLETFPEQHRQPPLVFAVASLLGARDHDAGITDFLRRNASALAAELAARPVQTNEPGRCAALTAALATIDGPVALLEIGASAGLCLYPDRYSYDYSGRRLHPADGPSAVTLTCTLGAGVEPPRRLPIVVTRAGVDLRPLDVTSPADAAWLGALTWPGQHDRESRVRGAIAIARHDPPHLLAGDAEAALDQLLALAPEAATPVVVTMGVLIYIPAPRRARLAERIRASGARWVSLEGARVLPRVEGRLRDAGWAEDELRGRFVLAVDEHPLAFSGPYGETLEACSPSAGA
ncbi:DUF2332 domain-containing protein [Salinibacterium sp. dk2585]|uniref:DUF2332 domain-containing protein n=1 Tax=unclassified Salinibacterium TaxID=2632331 RepID=UPI0011C24E22|nr:MULTISPECIES: DUF2332 domain-containing protein [unclassified Salinibacterium]QEE62195.1 DUF2332 domain-containing protein [Salinibacterium sp. dk2585]TXK53547.1 DUF2332 domain-containing protein [Salinibacterium sp. dk5596]